MTIKTARRLGWVAVVGVTLLVNSTAAFAQTSCDAQNIPGVRDSQAVARFLTGVRNDGGVRVGRVSYLNYNALAPRLKSIALAGFQRMEVQIGEPAQARAAEFVTASYFDVLGVQMQAGRPFAIAKDEPADKALEAVISHALWESMFDRQPSALGRTIPVNGRLVTIVGVAGPDFRGVDARMPISIWFPGVSLPVLTDSPGLRTDDRSSGGYYEFVVRQTAGTTLADASRELTAAARWLLEQYPAENAKFTDVGFHSADAVFGCAGR